MATLKRWNATTQEWELLNLTGGEGIGDLNLLNTEEKSSIVNAINEVDANLNSLQLRIDNKRELLFEGSWSNGEVKALPKSIYDYSFILIYWTTAPVVAIICPVIPSSSLLRGGNLYIAETGNVAINSAMFSVSGSGKELTLVRAAHSVNLGSAADREVGFIYGIR